jgi:hypothetical protein
MTAWLIRYKRKGSNSVQVIATQDVEWLKIELEDEDKNQKQI